MNKKAIERRYLENFLTSKKLEQEILSIEDSETPDFIVSTCDKKISIELTKLIDVDLKFIEEFRNSVIRTAKKTFKEKYDRELCCLIGLRNIKLGEKRIERQEQIEKYGAKLFDKVDRIYLDNYSNTDFDVTIECINERDDIVTRLRVTTKMRLGHWQYFGAHRNDWINLEWLTKKLKLRRRRLTIIDNLLMRIGFY
jgi:hypothetical protein